jgi:hypothetical protein
MVYKKCVLMDSMIKKARDSEVEANKGAQPAKTVIDDDAIIFG